MNIFYPENYGAKADGQHDDGMAIGRAIEEAVRSEGTVRFAENAVYFIKETPKGNLGPAAFTIAGANNVTLEGKNTTICVGELISYFNLTGSTNITLRGFRFELRPHAAFRGRLVSVCAEEVSAVISTDEPVPFEGGSYIYSDYTASRSYSFAMPDDNFRNHLYLRQIDRTGPGNTYKVWFVTERGTRDALRIVEDKRCDIIMPTPGFSHKGAAFHLLSSSEILIEDCDIREGSQFVGALKGNKGPITFNRVKMCSADDGDQPMVGWRDGYHCKDNTGPIHWKECEIGRLYDDAFNISATYLTVVEQPSEYELSLRSTENNGAYYKVSAGDILSAYDTFGGKIYCEYNKVTEVIHQHGAELRVRVENPVPPVDPELGRVIFDSHSAPGSTVEDSYITGTVRMRGPITVRNTRFDLMMMWFENEVGIEGPVPRDMLFENCDFTGTYPVDERYLINYLSFRTVQGWPGTAEYKCKNIRLENCRLDSKYTYIEQGNDVSFVNCRDN